MRKLSSKLTYPNVISTLCLFLLLGGGAYAATKLPKNSVGTKQLKKNAVTGEKVKNGSLSAGDFAQGQLPAGKEGPQGPKGDPGASGATNVVVRYGATVELEEGEEEGSFAECEPGETVTGGGWTFIHWPENSEYAFESWPTVEFGGGFGTPAPGDPATGWQAWLLNRSGPKFSFYSYVMCASP